MVWSIAEGLYAFVTRFASGRYHTNCSALVRMALRRGGVALGQVAPEEGRESEKDEEREEDGGQPVSPHGGPPSPYRRSGHKAHG